THFGPAYQPAAYIEDYRAALQDWAAAAHAGLASGSDEQAQIARLMELAQASLGPAAPAQEASLYEHASSTILSWHGLARYWRKRAEQAS
ncbi:MAG TPA: MBL fold metallo-hydrolase, partial [Roseiflexaceae bacterium]|nr:MBL fold metallo-hydrolase [Roseiflexaceae bacterium]